LHRPAQIEIRRSLAEALDPSRRKSLQAVRCTQESSEHSTPVYVVSAQIGVHDEALFRLVMVLQCKIKDRRHRVLDVTGRAETLAYNPFIRFIKPLPIGKTIQRILLIPDLLHKNLAEGLA
jgi:hypothetical protein